jgi:hypothetical protein
MTETIREQINRHGFAFIRGHVPELSTSDAGAHFGPVLGLPGFMPVQVLKPREKTVSTPNTYSGNFGHGDFPLHTDLAHWCVPPRYFLLRCITGTDSVVTRLLDGNEAVAAIGKPALSRALVQPRRPLRNYRPLLRLLDTRDRSTEFLRWDRVFIVPATPLSTQVYNAMKLVPPNTMAWTISIRNTSQTITSPSK